MITVEEELDEIRAEVARLDAMIAEAKTSCWCGSCRKRGQHHNGPCAAAQIRVEVGNRYQGVQHRRRNLIAVLELFS